MPRLLTLIASALIVAALAGPALAAGDPVAPPALNPGPVPCADTQPPSSALWVRRGDVLLGGATDRGCGAGGAGAVARVTVAISRHSGTRCRYMNADGTFGRRKSCLWPHWIEADGTDAWSFRLPDTVGPGDYQVRTRASDDTGNLGPTSANSFTLP